ncbi:hypothetical protein E2C01_061651 [Portunus trituberculatus]|uniref:Uncharacterized protein n=1 Tax=Portunus trituberculatus TaxID=210409 RepID=A0A5B7HBK0_PORTR|nr:hypothetical protein [Portunus trituberculatus]
MPVPPILRQAAGVYAEDRGLEGAEKPQCLVAGDRRRLAVISAARGLAAPLTANTDTERLKFTVWERKSRHASVVTKFRGNGRWQVCYRGLHAPHVAHLYIISASVGCLQARRWQGGGGGCPRGVNQGAGAESAGPASRRGCSVLHST